MQTLYRLQVACLWQSHASYTSTHNRIRVCTRIVHTLCREIQALPACPYSCCRITPVIQVADSPPSLWRASCPCRLPQTAAVACMFICCGTTPVTRVAIHAMLFVSFVCGQLDALPPSKCCYQPKHTTLQVLSQDPPFLWRASCPCRLRQTQP
jgi:hypothetical protein